MSNLQTWVNALRSGEYEQCKHVLSNCNESYCCYGVADIVIFDETYEPHGHSGLYYSNSNGEMHKLSGAKISSLFAELGKSTRYVEGLARTLMQMNDSGNSFFEIADTIEGEMTKV